MKCNQITIGFNTGRDLLIETLIFTMVNTPIDVWKKTIIRYRKNCQKILEVSPSVRYVGIVNAYGRTLTGIVRPKVKPLMKAEQVKNEFFIISTLMTLRKDTLNAMGKLEYVLLQHQNVSIVIFQRTEITYYISIDRKEKDIQKIISGIKKLL